MAFYNTQFELTIDKKMKLTTSGLGLILSAFREIKNYSAEKMASLNKQLDAISNYPKNAFSSYEFKAIDSIYYEGYIRAVIDKTNHNKEFMILSFTPREFELIKFIVIDYMSNSFKKDIEDYPHLIQMFSELDITKYQLRA